MSFTCRSAILLVNLPNKLTYIICNNSRMGFRKIITIILVLLLTSGMANCIYAQTNDSIAKKKMRQLFVRAYNNRRNASCLPLADSLYQMAIAAHNRQAEVDALNVRFIYEFFQPNNIANVEKQMKPLLAKAEEYGMTNIYYQTMTNKALYHLREHRYLDAIAFIDKEIEHARKHFFFVLRSLIRTSDALRRRSLRSVIKEKSSFFFVLRSLIRTFVGRMKQAMIFAAGLGTRLKPLTDTMPKALVPVNGVPLLDLIIRRLMAQGYERFVVNVHHFAQMIIDHVAQQDYAPLVRISDESDMLLDTGGGLKKAATCFDDEQSPILIHNVDILDNVCYDWFARQHNDEDDAVLLVSERKTKRYLLFDNAMRLMGWKNIETGEIKSPYEYIRRTGLSQHGEPLNMYAFSGIHSFSPRLFRLMERFPDKFSIIDFYLSICHRAHIYGCVKSDLKVLDVGKLNALDEAEKFLNNNK